jgi:carboxypeptidase C (cathepsin A)
MKLCHQASQCCSGRATQSEFQKALFDDQSLISQSYSCNWYGVNRVADAISCPSHEKFATKALEPYMVDGVEKGSFKSQDNLSFLRVDGAGHMVMYCRKFYTSVFSVV